MSENEKPLQSASTAMAANRTSIVTTDDRHITTTAVTRNTGWNMIPKISIQRKSTCRWLNYSDQFNQVCHSRCILFKMAQTDDDNRHFEDNEISADLIFMHGIANNCHRLTPSICTDTCLSEINKPLLPVRIDAWN